ncbi:Transposable element Tc1 transposase [Anabarilius grahami]|uniref:Transposable element Tc1 transposase n=1 Tax=Anabarilius grahami TaxID=495550 RepID=A0A3N0Z4J0_ANAGA|nr:Transposable element Tc1 transposase [Anabarilius grahami]
MADLSDVCYSDLSSPDREAVETLLPGIHRSTVRYSVPHITLAPGAGKRPRHPASESRVQCSFSDGVSDQVHQTTVGSQTALQKHATALPSRAPLLFETNTFGKIYFQVTSIQTSRGTRKPTNFSHEHTESPHHDNARPHVARICTQFLEAENIPVLAWPAYSPDMSPIKHVWDALDRRIRQRVPVPANIQQLRTAIEDEWTNIPQATINNLINSMRRRCVGLREANGGYTRY